MLWKVVKLSNSILELVVYEFLSLIFTFFFRREINDSSANWIVIILLISNRVRTSRKVMCFFLTVFIQMFI